MKVEDVRIGMRVCQQYDDDTPLWGIVRGEPRDCFNIYAMETQTCVDVMWEFKNGPSMGLVNIVHLHPDDAVNRLADLL